MTQLADLDSEPFNGDMLLLEQHSFQVAEDPGVRRQSALAMLSRVSQETTNSRQLFVEAAVLAVRTLESEHFVAAHLSADTREIVALSGPRPRVRSRVEVAEARFDRKDSRYLLAEAVDASEPLVVGDLAAAGRFEDPLLTELDAHSAIICPIQYAGHQYGAIGVLDRAPAKAATQDVMFLHSLSLLLGPAVAYQRTENVLAQHSAMLNATIDSLDSMVLVLSSDGKIMRLNQACAERTGFQVAELKHRHFWGAYLLPEEVSVAQAAFGRLRRGESPVKCEMFLLTKSGQRRRVAWSFTQLPQIENGVMSYVASGIDITEQHAALESLEKAEARVARLRSDREDGQSKGSQQNGESPPIPKNRRSALRKAFPYIQLIGQMTDGRLPHADEFQEVRCRDISPSGFSFVTKRPPNFQELVVALGAYPTQLYLTAKIIHVNRYREDGQDMMLVGCAYTSRVNL